MASRRGAITERLDERRLLAAWRLERQCNDEAKESLLNGRRFAFESSFSGIRGGYPFCSLSKRTNVAVDMPSHHKATLILLCAMCFIYSLSDRLISLSHCTITLSHSLSLLFPYVTGTFLLPTVQLEQRAKWKRLVSKRKYIVW